ncbi:ATP-binding protein [Leeia oryzae]|uniref:ATP-binding protein n=1 Tax=Leeia oryzae TaxID=356662 RepID=UPI0003A46EBC|nr:ATP-binding protein [Leeia oryzae]
MIPKSTRAAYSGSAAAMGSPMCDILSLVLSGRAGKIPHMKWPKLQSAWMQHPNSLNLARLVWLRGANLLLMLGVALWVSLRWQFQIPWLPLMLVAALLVLFNLATIYRLTQVASGWWVADQELLLQLLVDVTALGVVLFFADGASNPLASLLLIPVTLAATVLARWVAWVLGLYTVALYLLLMEFQIPLLQTGANPDQAWLLHRLGMGLTFSVSALMLVALVSRMAASLRQRDALLAEAREKTLQHEQVMALGAMAAGAAHELGTPLNTLQLLVDELAADKQPPQADDVRLMQQQLRVCKEILSQLASRAGQAGTRSATPVALEQALQALLARWQLLRPGVPLAVRWPDAPVPVMTAWPDTLNQALLNLLNNAADASPEQVAICFDWDTVQLRVTIDDEGPGISDDVLQQAGKAFIQSDKGGMGMGLLLSNATIGQLGGTVSLQRRTQGGTRTAVQIPLKPLQVATGEPHA